MTTTISKEIKLSSGFRVGDYQIVKFIANGAFGSVYEVSSQDAHHALKLESRDMDTKNLKMEATVLKELSTLNSSFFCQTFFFGRAETFDFIVMTLVGKNLGEIRADLPNQKFSRFTGLKIGVQMVTAIQQLHSIGYIHRDIKPGNFCISLSDPQQLVMVDFGMCRRYLEGSEKLRHPRWYVHGFRGTVRYAPLAVHHGRESARKDDLEAALYVIVELLVGTLPWTSMEEAVHVEHSKQVARAKGLHEFFSGCPKELIHILFYIDSLKYYDAPDYALIRGLLLSKCPENWELEWVKAK